jgi:arsenate reductase
LLKIEPRDLLRKGEEEYKTLNLKDETIDDHSIITHMSENPRLIERPIVIFNDRAIIGRPPENVLKLIN